MAVPEDKPSLTEAEASVLREKWKAYAVIFKAAIQYGVMLFLGLAVLFSGSNVARTEAIFVSFVPWVLAGALALALLGTVLWAIGERRLRQEKTRYFTDRIKKLELQIDPDRTSSNLDPTGRTNPEDE